MKRTLFLSLFALTALLVPSAIVIANCGDTWSEQPPVFGPWRIGPPLNACLDVVSGGAVGSVINPTTTSKAVKEHDFLYRRHEARRYLGNRKRDESRYRDSVRAMRPVLPGVWRSFL